MFKHHREDTEKASEARCDEGRAQEAAALRSALAALANGHRVDNADALPTGIAGPVEDLARAIARRDEQILAQTVQYSIQASEAMAATARITGEIRETDIRAQSMAAAVEELTASIDQIASTAKSVAGSMEVVSVGMRGGADATRSTAEASRGIGEAFGRMSTSAGHLASAAEQIGTFVATIDGLAQQTNLLALNATIEAARAGEAGKGFAVVAAEVKVLSGQTQKATDDIRARIDRLSEHVEEMMGTVNEVQGLVARSVEQSEDAAGQIARVLDDVAENGARMGEIASVLSQQSEAVQEISEGAQSIAAHAGRSSGFSEEVISAVGMSEKIIGEQFAELEVRSIPNFVLHKAKSDHLMWKKRLAEMLVGLKSLRSSELSDHHHCHLGEWYDAVEDDRVRRHPAFAALLPVHEAVHKCGREAARLHAAGDRAGAQKAADEMAAASTEVLRQLDLLIGASEH
ncbi:methyl-accepting chemotaxis sensory transducer [Breoghania corrubedonensis]|uniref:Methyl-accepting chemotaxis sensory transducer n=1 Tax=Breoghania corrubedonensis TaxID=665038 RepID=A0A2T5VD94_9HYPH|nr:methyl-accepting chemotaxis protein [Breoghania corrubedonensis]PTW61730.1 methyl-accepting chemotaxis sensory transducer [Breoghania corrubedonensis]